MTAELSPPPPLHSPTRCCEPQPAADASVTDELGWEFLWREQGYTQGFGHEEELYPASAGDGPSFISGGVLLQPSLPFLPPRSTLLRSSSITKRY